MPDDQAPKPDNNQPSLDNSSPSFGVPPRPQSSPFSSERTQPVPPRSDDSFSSPAPVQAPASAPSLDSEADSTPSFTEVETTSPAPEATTASPSNPFGSQPVSSPDQPVNSAPGATLSPFGPVSDTTQPVGTAPVAASPQFAAQPPLSTGGQKSSKKKFIILGAALAAVVVLLGGGVATYALWYQNPQKVLGDGLASVMSARAVDGTVSYESTEASGMKVNVTFDASNKDSQSSFNVKADISGQGMDLKLNGSGISDKDGNLFFKVGGVKEAIAKLDTSGIYASVYADVVNKYDNKWIKVSAADLKETGESNEKSKKCFDSLEKVSQSSQFKNDFSSTYEKNQFIVIKEDLGVKDGNFGYVVDVDKDKSKKFGEEFKNTESFKTLKADCPDLDDDATSDSTFDSSDSDSDKQKAKVTLWIAQFGHKLNKVDVNVDDTVAKTKSNVSLNIKHDQPADIKAPTDAVSIKDVMKDFEAAGQKYVDQYSAQYSSQYEGSYNSTSYQTNSLNATLFDILKG